MDKIIEFEGIPSGDYESFCWDVSEEMFIKIKKCKPNNKNKSFFHEGLYRIYPDDIYIEGVKCKTIIKINC